jgi:hypothetical protein
LPYAYANDFVLQKTRFSFFLSFILPFFSFFFFFLLSERVEFFGLALSRLLPSDRKEGFRGMVSLHAGTLSNSAASRAKLGGPIQLKLGTGFHMSFYMK